MNEPRMEKKKAEMKADISKRWQELLIEYENRVNSSSEFCKRHKISRSNLYKWRKYFSESEEVRLEQQSGNKDRIANANIRKRQEKDGFIPLVVEPKDINKLEKAIGGYDKKISDNQDGKINSPIKVRRNCGLTIEFTDGCTMCEYWVC